MQTAPAASVTVKTTVLEPGVGGVNVAVVDIAVALVLEKVAVCCAAPLMEYLTLLISLAPLLSVAAKLKAAGWPAIAGDGAGVAATCDTVTSQQSDLWAHVHLSPPPRVAQ